MLWSFRHVLHRMTSPYQLDGAVEMTSKNNTL
jgi:hypothetical protein